MSIGDAMPRAGSTVRASTVVASLRAGGEAMRRFGLAATFAGGAVPKSPVLCACGSARPCVRTAGVAAWCVEASCVRAGALAGQGGARVRG